MKPKRKPSSGPRRVSAAMAVRRDQAPCPIVGVGASAGGLEAFTLLLRHLPADTGLGFVLVQHLDPAHESALTQLLARATTMRVREATHNVRVEANCVYVIPPNRSLGIARGVHISLPALFSAMPLIVSAYIAISRVRDRWHNTDDVVIGCAIGILAGMLAWRHYVTLRREGHAPTTGAAHLEAKPSAVSGAFGVDGAGHGSVSIGMSSESSGGEPRTRAPPPGGDAEREHAEGTASVGGAGNNAKGSDEVVTPVPAS